MRNEAPRPKLETKVPDDLAMFPSSRRAWTKETASRRRQMYWANTVIVLIWGRTGSHAPSMRRHSMIFFSLCVCVCLYMCV